MSDFAREGQYRDTHPPTDGEASSEDPRSPEYLARALDEALADLIDLRQSAALISTERDRYRDEALWLRGLAERLTDWSATE